MSILIHCSSLSDIVTEPKGKKVLTYFKDGIEINTASFNKLLMAGKLDGVACTSETVVPDELSETAKSEVLRIWIANNYGKSKEYSTKYTEKGNTCEEAAITMFSRWSGIPCFKNEQFYKNKYLIGTPDILEDDVLADVKNSWSMETFMKATADDYFEQINGYMDITKIHRAYLVFCLINCPEPILLKEIYFQQQRNPMDDPAKVEKQVRENLTFDNVPFEKRMKVFEFTYDPAFIEKAYKKIEAARKYYDGLVLEDVKPFNLVTA